VGYAGGTKKNPTYYSMGDHSESIKIVFNPQVITYEKLVAIFFEHHDPTCHSSRQYMSAIWYHGDEQKKAAIKVRDEHQKHMSDKIVTEIAPAGVWTDAEEYHQKYYKKNSAGCGSS